MPKWTPFQEAERDGMSVLRNREAMIAEIQKRTGLSFQDAVKSVDGLLAEEFQNRVYINNRYQVYVTEIGSPFGQTAGPMVWLSIKRLDRNPIHDWRDLQRIKNELVGVDCEGVELYPSELRKVDQANQYHMFVMKTPGLRFPFGFNYREVSEKKLGDAKQRPFRESR